MSLSSDMAADLVSVFPLVLKEYERGSRSKMVLDDDHPTFVTPLFLGEE